MQSGVKHIIVCLMAIFNMNLGQPHWFSFSKCYKPVHPIKQAILHPPSHYPNLTGDGHLTSIKMHLEKQVAALINMKNPMHWWMFLCSI